MAKRGSSAAIEELVRCHEQSVYSLALRLARDTEDSN
jgi:hypothetical protein